MDREENRKLEQLHALADNELGPEEHERLLDELNGDSRLTAELCDIRRIKDLLNYAYPLQDGRERPSAAGGGGLKRVAGVAVLAAAAFTGGWWLSDPGAPAVEGFRLADVRSDPSKVLLYLGESDPAKFRAVLEKARVLLETYRSRGTEVYVVTSAGGVDLLRATTSPVAGEIRALKARYASLHFVACNNTLFNLRKKGQAVKLVEEAEVAPSAVGFVVDRLKQGWTYVAI